MVSLGRISVALVVGFIVVILTSCASMQSELIEAATNSPDKNYPRAVACDTELVKTPVIDLSRYKSVQSRKHQRTDIAIALASSGGGYRAANLTLGVLLGLEHLDMPHSSNNLLQEVDYYSTVSGGGFGVGFYLTQLHNYIDYYRSTRGFSLACAVDNLLRQDMVGENVLRADLSNVVSFGKDDESRFERRVNETILYTRQGGLRLCDVFVPKESRAPVLLPYWANNATIFLNAETFPFTPDVLDRYRIIGYFHNNCRYYTCGPRPFPLYQMPLSVALAASATVPFAFPATTLISLGSTQECYLQLLDGGLSDNSGVYTALNLLEQDPKPVKVLIIVDAYRGNRQPFARSCTPPKSLPLLSRIFTSTTDANREHIKSTIHYVAHGLLCSHGAKNVVVVYLDLSGYPIARRIGTNLSMTARQQRMLLDVGQELVENDPTLNQFLDELSRGKLTIGGC